MPNTRLYWLHAISPTHAGVGQGVGYIDLPIDRDGVTGWPIIRGSAFKGVWADSHRATDDARQTNAVLRAAFGVAGDNNNSNAGALVPSDAQLVCLPVRSFRGTFAWCTSSLCLRLLRRTLTLSGAEESKLPPAPDELADGHAHPSGTSLLEEDRIFLEDLDFVAQQCTTAAAWADKIAAWVFPSDDAWQRQFKNRFVVLSDAAFDFLCETGTEIHTRVRIHDEYKVVEKGALWTEEALPAETILGGIVQCDRIFGHNGGDITPNGLLDQFASGSLMLQIGGKATVGRGQMRCVFAPVNGGAQ